VIRFGDPEGEGSTIVPEPTKELNSMRPVRTIAAALLVASVAVAGCSTRDTSPPSDAAPAAAAPTTPPPDQPTPDQPTRRPPMARPPSTAATSQPPRILQVATHPKLSEMNGRLLLPDRVEVEVLATGVDRARLVLTPTGTAAAYYSKVVAETTPAEDGLWLVWHPFDGAIGSLTIQVTGPGGSARHAIGDVYHE
jgi:glucose/arabinose dehydrogenase